jgi:DNA-binding CsgD family transcriptional regulator
MKVRAKITREIVAGVTQLKAMGKTPQEIQSTLDISMASYQRITRGEFNYLMRVENVSQKERTIARLTVHGMTQKDIAEWVGKSAKYVRDVQRTLQVEPISSPQKIAASLSITKLKKLKKQGNSYKAIAEHVGVSASTVSRLFSKLG